MVDKSNHFILVNAIYSVSRLAKLYVNHIFNLHGISVSVVLDKGSQFFSPFWFKFLKALGTRLDFNIAFQTDG